MRTVTGDKINHVVYNDIISVDNLLVAWKEFIKGKRAKKDVMGFQHRLLDNVLDLHAELESKTYIPGGYYAFKISDPKPRDIHKASVRDRLVHHAVYRTLYPIFDRKFIADSYSCRKDKGTHRAMERFKEYTYKIGRNDTKTFYILKCDIKKFFASIDHTKLLESLRTYISDADVIELVTRIVESFHSTASGKGLPLGNLTSQLLVNGYMNEFDQFVKHSIKAKYYIRYADDFVFMSQNRKWLESLIPIIGKFLMDRLGLKLHPYKVFIKTMASGVDFLGWVHFPDHRVLRTATKRRMLKALRNDPKPEAIVSYLGMLKHGNAHKLSSLVSGYR